MTTRTEGHLFDMGMDADARLIGAYRAGGRTLDDLPYTEEFESIMQTLRAVGETRPEHEILHRLQNLRKAGKLPTLGRSRASLVVVTQDEEALLARAVIASVGSLGQRDQLPHTPAMDRIVAGFNRETGRQLSPHDVWRLVAKLAK